MEWTQLLPSCLSRYDTASSPTPAGPLHPAQTCRIWIGHNKSPDTMYRFMVQLRHRLTAKTLTARHLMSPSAPFRTRLSGRTLLTATERKWRSAKLSASASDRLVVPAVTCRFLSPDNILVHFPLSAAAPAPPALDVSIGVAPSALSFLIVISR